MSIDYFVGTEGATIHIDRPNEVHGAIDLLHTQTMDNLPKEPMDKILPILERAMRELEAIGYDSFDL